MKMLSIILDISEFEMNHNSLIGIVDDVLWILSFLKNKNKYNDKKKNQLLQYIRILDILFYTYIWGI